MSGLGLAIIHFTPDQIVKNTMQSVTIKLAGNPLDFN
jgi:hypothetical protein